MAFQTYIFGIIIPGSPRQEIDHSDGGERVVRGGGEVNAKPTLSIVYSNWFVLLIA